MLWGMLPLEEGHLCGKLQMSRMLLLRLNPIPADYLMAEALTAALQSKDLPARVYVGMRYWHPFTEDAINQIKKDGITRLVVLPLYPQFSISTSGYSLRLLESIFMY